MNLFIALFVSLSSLVFGYDEADLLFVGDAMQHQAQLDAARVSKNNYDYSGCFVNIAPLVSLADLAVVNLETPVGDPPHSGYPCFNAPPQFLDALADCGFGLFLTANNHTLDRRAKGLRSTIQNLDKRELPHLGTYASDSARNRNLPLIMNINGIDVGFLNYTYGTNGIKPSDGVVVDYIDRAKIKADVDSTRAAGAELIAVGIHWGDEYKLLPNQAQKHTADFLEAIGVDLIIGAHPHVIQPMEFRPNRYFPEKKVLLVYSLGNFISNMKTADTRGGAGVQIKLYRDEKHRAAIKNPRYRLFFTVPGTSAQNNFHVLEVRNVEGSWKSRADEFARRARAIFDKHNIDVPEATELSDIISE
ncbi:MAG: CapA family protein [Bacteroidales bacterium]|nr:CapA family protein [Bacteroidales bacterium]